MPEDTPQNTPPELTPLEEAGINKIFHGDALREAVHASSEEKVPLIAGLIYSKTVTQIFADDGLGKSISVLNLALEASAGVPVFKALECPRPINIIWHCAERPLDEPFERIKSMLGDITPNFNNLVFDKEIQGINFSSVEGLTAFLIRNTELQSRFENGKTDLIIIDPIYSITGGDLSSPKDAHTINHLIRRLQDYFNCAILYTHHSNRGQMHEGKRTEGDMFGSRFLRANITGQFHLRKTDDGVELVCKKNTYANLLSHIPLIFDEINQTLTMSTDYEEFGKRDRVLFFLRKKFSEKKEFALREISNQLKVSDAYIRKIIGPYVRSGIITNKNIKGAKATYFVEKNI
jgi:RecA-family ATPase